MRIRYRRPRFALALLTALVASASAATADDVVVMPFRCAVVDGKPVLTPADETGHRVLGKLEQQKVKTCSTVDPKRCRQWTTFRFDMDCGGARVPWMQVFANASDHTRRRVWERNGSLRVQDTPRRSKRIDDMCARRMGVNQEWWSVNEICDEVSPLNTPKATEMPAGFAPMVGLDAVLLPEDAITMPRARVAKAQAPVPARSEAAPIKQAPQARPAVRPPAASDARTTATADTTQSSTNPIRTGAVGELKPVAPAAIVPSEPAVEPTTAREPATPAVERASPDNLPDRAAVPLAQTVTAEADKTETQTEVPPIEAKEPAGGIPQENNTVSEPTAPREAASEPAVSPKTIVAVNERGTDGSDHSVAYVIVALAGALLLAMLLIVRWLGRADTREAAAYATKAEPTIGPLPIAPETHRADGVPSAAVTALAITPHHHVIGQVTPVNRSAHVSIGDRMPSSKDEALELLGMGVASDSNLSSLKKIIDGLRMNWHPDLARDDADRRVREVRLKQINAAWDILGGKAA